MKLTYIFHSGFVLETEDVVMFPIDGRIGNGYTFGARQFIERFKVGQFVPMHFSGTRRLNVPYLYQFKVFQGIQYTIFIN